MKVFKISRSGYVSEACATAKMTDSGYFYYELGGGGFNRPKKVWINSKAIKMVDDKYVIADKLDYRVTEKGNIVLIPGDKDIAVVFAECGYRGGSKIETTAKVIAKEAYYHSQRGSLGVSEVILCEVREGDRFTVNRTGRLYGAEPEIVLIYTGGTLIKHVNDEELESLL